MVRTTIPSAILVMTLAVGCNATSDEQKQINSARAEANDKSGAAAAPSEERVTSAPREEDKKVSGAQPGFMKLLEDRDAFKADGESLEERGRK